MKVKVSTFFRFWEAQNAINQMYGLPELNWGEIRTLWRSIPK